MADDTRSNASTSRPGSPVPSSSGDLPRLRSNQPTFRFTWDRKRGPGSVSSFSEVESKADYAGNLNSARGEIQGLNNATFSAGALGSHWSSSIHGFHGMLLVVYI
jgi:vacuolar protein sorting-associated protein 54